jgi:hypothetical protein
VLLKNYCKLGNDDIEGFYGNTNGSESPLKGITEKSGIFLFISESML